MELKYTWKLYYIVYCISALIYQHSLIEQSVEVQTVIEHSNVLYMAPKIGTPNRTVTLS